MESRRVGALSPHVNSSYRSAGWLLKTKNPLLRWVFCSLLFNHAMSGCMPTCTMIFSIFFSCLSCREITAASSESCFLYNPTKPSTCSIISFRSFSCSFFISSFISSFVTACSLMNSILSVFVSTSSLRLFTSPFKLCTSLFRSSFRPCTSPFTPSTALSTSLRVIVSSISLFLLNTKIVYTRKKMFVNLTNKNFRRSMTV